MTGPARRAEHKALTTVPQSNAKVKTGQLWSKNKDDLKKQLDELKLELGQLRTQKIAGGAASKLTRMYVVRPHTQRRTSPPEC